MNNWKLAEMYGNENFKLMEMYENESLEFGA